MLLTILALLAQTWGWLRHRGQQKSPLHRKQIQQLYLDVLNSPNPEGHPLDYDTIVETLLPWRQGVVIPLKDRRTVRIWVDQLVDEGILVRDPARDRKQGDFFIANPISLQNRSALQRFADLPDPADLTPTQKRLIPLLVVISVLLFFTLYYLFLPSGFVGQITGAMAMASAALAWGGLRLQDTTRSLWESVRDLRIYRWLWRVAIDLGALVALGLAFPCWVSVSPGSTIYVDGKKIREVRGVERTVGAVTPGAAGTPAEHLEWFYLPWGPHDISVRKPWHVDQDSWAFESSSRVWLPFQREASSDLVAFVHVEALDSPGQPFVGTEDAEHRRQLNEDVQNVLLTTQELFVASGSIYTGNAVGHDNSRPLHQLKIIRTSAGSLKLVGQAEHDPIGGQHYLVVSCVGPQGNVIKSLPPIPLYEHEQDGAHPHSGENTEDRVQDIRRAAERLRDLILEELDITAPSDLRVRWEEMERERMMAAGALAHLGARQSLRQIAEAEKQIASASTLDRRRRLLVEGDTARRRATTQLRQALRASASPGSPFERLVDGTTRTAVQLFEQRGRAALEARVHAEVRGTAQSIGTIAVSAAQEGKRELANSAVSALAALALEARRTGNTRLGDELAEKRQRIEASVQQALNRRPPAGGGRPTPPPEDHSHP